MPMSPYSRFAVVIFLTLALSAAAVAQNEFRDSASVVAVEIPVQVIDRGEPVRGLTIADFEVYDGKKKQKITDFDIVDLATIDGPVNDRTLPMSGRRHFLLLFDLTFASPSNLVKARQGAKELVAEALHPTDLVAVASYSRSQGPQLALGFTSDRWQVAQAIDSLGLPEFSPARLDAAGIVFGTLQGGDRSFARDLILPEFEGLPTATNERLANLRADLAEAGEQATANLLNSLRGADRANRRVMSNEIVSYSRTFTDLAKILADVSGRKHVVLLSEGFDTSILYGTADEAEQRQISQTVESGEIWNVDSEQRFGDTRSQTFLNDMIEAFRRSNCTIQAVDVGGIRTASDAGIGSSLGTPGSTAREDSLFLMANGTGGELYRNYNDLAVAMGDMLRRNSHTYVLTIEPKKLVADGSYHALKVKLKNRKGARVVHRPGYYAPDPMKFANPVERKLETGEMILRGAELRDLEVEVLFSALPTDDEDAYVPVVFEIAGPALLEGSMFNEVPVEIYAYALDERGTVRDFFNQVVTLDRRKVEERLSHSGLKFFGHLEVPPASYTIRTLVRNQISGRSHLAVTPLEVPPYDGGPGPLQAFFLESSPDWLLVTDRGAGEAPALDPYLKAGGPLVPAVRPELAAGVEVTVVISGYRGGETPPAIASRILGASGETVRQDVLTVAETASDDRLMASLDTGGLSPGEYDLVIDVLDPDSGRSVSSIARFGVSDR